jgi:1,4-dihydroxy-2-naphthoate octaprenyltransferase
MGRPDQVVLVLVVAAAGAAAGVAAGVANPDAGTGSGLAGGAADGAWPSAVTMVVAALAVVAAAFSIHAANEAADVHTDTRTDLAATRTPFSGGSGAAGASGLPPDAVRRFGLRLAAGGGLLALALALAGAVTGVLAVTAVVLLLVGLVGGWAYSVGPALSRRGWGEVLNAVLGGLLLPLYGMAVVRGSVGTTHVVLFVPFTLLVFVSMLETQWPDRLADVASGRHTLTSRLMPTTLRRLAGVSAAAAYLLVALLASSVLPWPVVTAFVLVLPLSVVAVHRLTRVERPLPAVVAMVAAAVGQLGTWAVAVPLLAPVVE